eukprot:5437899-Ditylum_brightwellii.AAC.1
MCKVLLRHIVVACFLAISLIQAEAQLGCCMCNCTATADPAGCTGATVNNSILDKGACDVVCGAFGGAITQNCCFQPIPNGPTGPCDTPVVVNTSASHITQSKMGLLLVFAGAFLLGSLL